MKKNRFSIIVLLMLGAIITGQSPGGISQDLTLWYRADMGVTGSSGVTSWANQAGGYDLAYTSGGYHTYNTATKLLNFNPSISTTGHAINGLKTGIMPNNIVTSGSPPYHTSHFTVFSTPDPTATVAFYRHNNNGSTGTYSISAGASGRMLIANRFNEVGNPMANQATMYSMVGNAGTANPVGMGRRNGAAFGTTWSGGIGIGGSNSFYFGGGANADVGEIIVYNTAKTSGQRQLIESYLAIKYGITMNNGGTDYLSSASVPVWSTATNNGYNNNIFGIGRNDISVLHQKQSKSVNDGQKLIIGHGSSLFDTNPDNTNDLEEGKYLIVGDNGLQQALSITATPISLGSSYIYKRFDAIWKVQNTNSTGTVIVAWPKGTADLHLIRSSDSAFDTNDTFIPMTGEVTINGVVYNTATVTFADGNYFTFAAKLADTDNDGISDNDDLDDDNDGILDTDECYGEMITNGTFTGNANGWDLGGTNPWLYYSGSGGAIRYWTDNQADKILSQNLASNGINRGIVNGQDYTLKFSLAGVNYSSGFNSTAKLTIKLGGVVYAEFENNATDTPIKFTLYNGATSDLNPFTPTAAITFNEVSIRIPNHSGAGSLLEFIANTAADDWYLDNISMSGGCDTDGDGIPDYLDLDSDNDGCLDATEGTENVTTAMLVNAASGLSVGTGSTASNQNLGTTVDSQGVPTVVNTGGAADGGNNTQGQGAGASANANLNYCTDTDGDGVPDYQDLDNDNDGILDIDEGYTCGKASIPAAVLTTDHVMNYTFTDYNGIKGFKFKLTSSANAQRWASPAAQFNMSGIDPRINGNKVIYEFDLPVDNFKFWVGDFDAQEKVNINFYDENGSRITNLLPFSKVKAEVAVGRITFTNDASYGVKISTTNNSAANGNLNYVEIYTPGLQISKVEATFVGSNGNTPEYHIGGMCAKRDSDGDRIPDYLDLDSDNDGCLDAIEGAENVTAAMLANASSGLSVGTGSTAANQNLGTTVDSQGVPTVVNTGGAADGGNNTQGQGVGSSQSASVNTCFCYKPGATASAGNPALITKVGITSLNRAGTAGDNWPAVRTGGWLALESKTKGFVPNRVAFSGGNPVGIAPANFVEGMLVYDTTDKCMKLYTSRDGGTTFGWYCINTQACPDN